MHISLIASLQASTAAFPIAKVARLPWVGSLTPKEPVSTTFTLTSSYGIPSVSDTIRAIDALLPPISGVPIDKETVPSSPKAMEIEVSPPWFIQNPEAIPLP